MEKKKSSYFGSVRFYKNLILVVVLLAIGLGIFFSLHYRSCYKSLLKKITPVNGIIQYEIDAEGPLYQSIHPDFYAPEEYGATTRNTKEAYLTFNILTYNNVDKILDILREKDVKATFFVTGSEKAGDKEILRKIVDGGHTLGMLSWSKDYATIYSSVESYLEDMYQLFTYIHDVTGVTPTVFRFIGGSINSYNSGNYQELIAEMVRRGFVPYDWNVSVQETQTTPTAEAQIRTVSEALNRMDRIIVLLQDTQDSEILAEALPGIIEAIHTVEFTIKPLTPEIKPVLFAYSE